MNSVCKNEADRLNFLLTLLPSGKVKVIESGVKKKVAVNGAYKHGRYERIYQKIFLAMSNVIILPRKMHRQTDGQPDCGWMHEQN